MPKSKQGKRIASVIKKYTESGADFRKKVKREMGSSYTKEGYQKVFEDTKARGNMPYLNAFAKVLEIDVNELKECFSTSKKEKKESPKEKATFKATELPMKKPKNPIEQKKKEKVDGIILKIEAMREGQKLPKAIMFEAPIRKSELHHFPQTNGKWTVQVMNDELRLMSEFEMTEAEKEKIRTGKRITFVLLVD